MQSELTEAIRSQLALRDRLVDEALEAYRQAEKLIAAMIKKRGAAATAEALRNTRGIQHSNLLDEFLAIRRYRGITRKGGLWWLLCEADDGATRQAPTQLDVAKS